MTIKLQEETHKYLVGSVKRFFSEELEEHIGDLKAMLVLDFFVREMGPSDAVTCRPKKLRLTQGRGEG